MYRILYIKRRCKRHWICRATDPTNGMEYLEVMQKYGFSYDEKTLTQCLKIEYQHEIIQWDAAGNII
jgi:hypothetical protein